MKRNILQRISKLQRNSDRNYFPQMHYQACSRVSNEFRTKENLLKEWAAKHKIKFVISAMKLYCVVNL